jgi:hypothetical protein
MIGRPLARLDGSPARDAEEARIRAEADRSRSRASIRIGPERTPAADRRVADA